MPVVTKYRVVLYGASADRPDLKAKIELYSGADPQTAVSVGKLKFLHGPNPLPVDLQDKGSIVMHLPAENLGAVLELLRNETPIYFSFHEGRGVLGTGVEPVGVRDESVAARVHVVGWDAPPPAPAAAPAPAPTPA